jgi:osmoprotectant transport system ATP-binding protein
MDGVTAGELGGAIDADASLEDALALLMREDKPMIGVKQGATFLGVLTPNGVHRALRASVSSQE